MLAPGALEQALTAANAAGVRARIVVEGANAPTTPDADAILEADGVLVIPDILARRRPGEGDAGGDERQGENIRQAERARIDGGVEELPRGYSAP